MPSVLIVDDLLSIHEMLEAVIQPTGYKTTFATDGEKALARYKADKFDLVLADIDMKPMDGITMLRQLRVYDPNAVVIIMTAYASTESAVQALKFGAFDYLQKPFRVDDLISTLKRALEFRRISLEKPAAPVVALVGASVETSANARDIEAQFVGVSAAHKKLVAQVRKLTTVRTPVLLQGEAGTGKSTIAEMLHRGVGQTIAAEVPFVRIDCASCSEDNFRAGLIGDTGAGGTWIAQARGGTMFLQNLEKLAQSMQHDLVGVLRAHAQSFRLICTTSEDLERLTEEGRFDDELFYRVASLPVMIPPLRDRPEDIPHLVKFYTQQASNPTFDSSSIEFTAEALAEMKAYSWPGNMTDLSQVVNKIVTAAETRQIGADQLPLRVKDLGGWPELTQFLAVQEKHYIDQVLKACRGDKKKAAKILGIELSRVG